MKISLLHPTRSRPEKSFKAVDIWMKRTKNVELIVSLDSDDPMLSRYLQHFPNAIVNHNRSAVDAVNRAAEVCKGDIMIVVSDDTECPRNWESLVNQSTEGKHDFVLKVNDGVQIWIVTMPILDRAYYNRFGYIYHPDYRHQFVDTHFTHVADALKRIIWRNDLLFPHRHKKQMDNVYRRSDATWYQGKTTYLHMLKHNLGLPKSVDIMNLSKFAEQHKDWLRKNVR